MIALSPLDRLLVTGSKTMRHLMFGHGAGNTRGKVTIRLHDLLQRKPARWMDRDDGFALLWMSSQLSFVLLHKTLPGTVLSPGTWTVSIVIIWYGDVQDSLYDYHYAVISSYTVTVFVGKASFFIHIMVNHLCLMDWVRVVRSRFLIMHCGRSHGKLARSSKLDCTQLTV